MNFYTSLAICCLLALAACSGDKPAVVASPVPALEGGPTETPIAVAVEESKAALPPVKSCPNPACTCELCDCDPCKCGRKDESAAARPVLRVYICTAPRCSACDRHIPGWIKYLDQCGFPYQIVNLASEHHREGDRVVTWGAHLSVGLAPTVLLHVGDRAVTFSQVDDGEIRFVKPHEVAQWLELEQRKSGGRFERSVMLEASVPPSRAEVARHSAGQRGPAPDAATRRETPQPAVFRRYSACRGGRCS